MRNFLRERGFRRREDARVTDRFGQTERRASRNLNGAAPERPESATPLAM
jgi:hypothetical protein